MAYELIDEGSGARARFELLPDEPAVVSTGKALNSIPRQLGLTTRYALEGPAQAAQIVTEPIRQLVTDPLLRLFGWQGQSKPLGEVASDAASGVGLPTPETPTERVVGDATRLVAGSGGMLGAARAAFALPGLGGTVGSSLAANPAQQLSAAAGGGLAGGASREAGGSPLEQGIATVVGSVAGGMAPAGISRVTGAARSAFTPKLTPQELDVRISGLVERAGGDWSRVPERARQSLRRELGAALKAGEEVDPAAVRRLADFASVGATPTRGMVSQNPVQITREMNLAKMAANSSDGQLHGLPLLQNRNNNVLIGRLNDLGASAGGEARDAGQTVAGSVLARQEALRGAERTAWDAARNAPGYSTQPIYPDALNRINQALGDEGMMPFMNPTISRYMEAFQTGRQPFTAQAYRNLQSMLSNEMSQGGNTAAAARIARNALESTPIAPITNPRGIDLGLAPVTGQMAQAMRNADAQAGSAIEAVNRARAATRAAYAFEESSPLVRQVLSAGRSAEPERIAQNYVINGSLSEAREIAGAVGPAGRETIKNALVNHIKQQALSGRADEVGTVSQAALNKALNKIGDQKLSLFFGPEELAQLRAVGRVASYMQNQPAGSAVNNSNTAGAVMGRLLDLSTKVPIIGPNIGQPLRNIEVSVGQRAAQNITPGLLANPPVQPLRETLLLPGAAIGGGLLSSQ